MEKVKADRDHLLIRIAEQQNRHLGELKRRDHPLEARIIELENALDEANREISWHEQKMNTQSNYLPVNSTNDRDSLVTHNSLTVEDAIEEIRDMASYNHLKAKHERRITYAHMRERLIGYPLPTGKPWTVEMIKQVIEYKGKI